MRGGAEMNRATMEKLKDVLCCELEDMGEMLSKRGGVSAGELDALRNLTGALKNLYKIEHYEADPEEHAKTRGAERAGHSKRRSEMRDRLGELMDCADDDECRDIIRRCMEQFK